MGWEGEYSVPYRIGSSHVSKYHFFLAFQSNGFYVLFTGVYPWFFSQLNIECCSFEISMLYRLHFRVPNGVIVYGPFFSGCNNFIVWELVWGATLLQGGAYFVGLGLWSLQETNNVLLTINIYLQWDLVPSLYHGGPLNTRLPPVEAGTGDSTSFGAGLWNNILEAGPRSGPPLPLLSSLPPLFGEKTEGYI